MKILYLYSGERKKRFKGVPGVDYPDTQFYGLNHLANFGIDAEYKEAEDYVFLRFAKKIFGFRAKHLLMFFVARNYDIVFGISVMYMLLLKKCIPTKTKFVIFNSVLNRMLLVHKEGTFKRRILFWILKEADAIVFLARAHMDKVINTVPFLRDKCFFVPMGVDNVYYQPVYENREDFYLSVGRDNARDYKTIAEVARTMPLETFHFVCLPRNIEMIEDIPSNVQVHVNIPLEELKEMYKKARALLLIMHNDSYIEGSDSSGPTVLLEAMAIGLPVVASNKEYLNDYVEHDKSAYLVDFYDVDAIVATITKLSDSKKRDELARNARYKVDGIFNTKEMAHGLSVVFKKIHDK